VAGPLRSLLAGFNRSLTGKPPLKLKIWARIGSLIWFTLGLGLATFWPGALYFNPRAARIFIILGWWLFGLVLAILGVRSRTKIGAWTGMAGLFEFLILFPWLFPPQLAG